MVVVSGTQKYAGAPTLPRARDREQQQSKLSPEKQASIRPLTLAKLGGSDNEHKNHNIFRAGGMRATSFPQWNVQDEDVHPVPLFFPIERTHVVVNHTSCSIIAGRVARCLRMESILAKFSKQEASALAETSDNVHFCIRLFRHNRHPDRIIVEIQRRSGSCISFHNKCQVILRAARGLASKKVESYKPLVASDPSMSKPPEEMDEVLELVGSLLKKDRLDARLLGMESLRRLSDAKSSGNGRAVCLAEKILSQKDHISETVFSLVRFRKRVMDDDDELDSFFGDSKHHATMHRHALAILANSLSLLSPTERGRKYKNQLAQDGGLVSALVQLVENAESSSHDSYEAARCLNMLSDGSD